MPQVHTDRRLPVPSSARAHQGALWVRLDYGLADLPLTVWHARTGLGFLGEPPVTIAVDCDAPQVHLPPCPFPSPSLPSHPSRACPKP